MRTQGHFWTLACVGAALAATPAACAHDGSHPDPTPAAHGHEAGVALLHAQDTAPSRPRVMIGVSMGPVSEAIGAQLGVDPSRVVMITDVSEDMPAAAAGVRRFDIVIAVDGESPVSDALLRERVLSKAPGEPVRLRVLRSGREQDIEIRVKAVEEIVIREGEGEGRGVVRTPAPPQAPEPPRAPRAAREADQERAIARALREHARAEGDRARAVWQEFGEEHRQAMQELAEQLRELEAELGPEAREALQKAMEEVRRAMQQNFEFRFRQDAEAPAIEFFPRNGDEGVVILQEPTPAPGAPGQWSMRTAPGQPVIAERNREFDERLNSLESRLDRIERMLERLVERESQR